MDTTDTVAMASATIAVSADATKTNYHGHFVRKFFDEKKAAIKRLRALKEYLGEWMGGAEGS